MAALNSMCPPGANAQVEHARALGFCVPDVRHLALRYDWVEVQHNESSRVIAFTKDCSGAPARISVYYTTGCVGSVIQHPKHVSRTQMFRRDCTLEELEEIFSNPRVHTGKGYQRRQDMKPAPGESDREEVDWLRRELKDVEENIAGLTASRDEFRTRIDALEEAEKAKARAIEEAKKAEARAIAEAKKAKARAIAEAKKAEAEAERKRDRSLNYHFTAFHSKTLQKMSTKHIEDVRCVAMGGEATLMIRDDGRWYYTPDVPTDFFESNMRGLRGKKCIYVAMGSNDRWYCKFDDGSHWWGSDVPDDLSDAIDENSSLVNYMAFGEDYDSYFVMFENREYTWNNVPSAVDRVLSYKGRNRSALKFVSLGPNGEYFIRLENGRMWWGGMDDDGMKAIRKLGNKLKSLYFGDDYSWFARYTEE